MDNNVKFSAGGTGNLTITANVATISKIELMVSKNNSNPTTIPVEFNTTSIDVLDGKKTYCQMPVKWDGKTSVTFSCGTRELRVFGATIYYQNIPGELRLLSVTAPTITLNNLETTDTQLQFTITQKATEQEGTTLETWYTTDGSNPNATDNTNRVKLDGISQTVNMPWSNNADVKVIAFTKRVKINSSLIIQ